jgi:two-component system chemotaxis sensor kinase CheA
MLTLDAFAKFAHTLEDLLHAVRTGQAQVTSELATLLLRAIDTLRSMLAALRDGEPDNPLARKALEAELTAWVGKAERDADPDADAAARTGGAAVPSSEEGSSAYLDGQRGPALRIEMARIDQLLDLASRALVVQGQMGAGLLETAGSNDYLMELHQKGERLLMELQDWVIETRMIPISMFFRSHARTIRDAASAQRKRVRLHIEGERVRVDTAIGESARDVLTHLVRNAIDHGIETPAARAQQGKDPEGTVTLRAFQNGNQVVIQVGDDGAGLNLSKIRAQARRIGRADADNLGVEDLHQLVFAPGFSTADRVTEMSGRGVGMDVVRRRVEDLHGTVEIDSREGLGTTIELRLPLSLSVIEGFWIEVAGVDYVLPLDEVLECLELPPDLRARAESDGIIDLRGEPVAYVNLAGILDPGRKGRAVNRIVVVRYRARRIGLGVHTIHGERQTVIKPLGRLFRSVPGISGSTMRPDGGVAFVIDVARLLRSASRPGAIGVVPETTSIRGPAEL